MKLPFGKEMRPSVLNVLAGKISTIASDIIAMRIWPWAWRTKFLNILGVEVASSSRIGHGIEIVGVFSNLIVHKDVYINAHAYIQTSARVTIHEKARIGPFFRLLTTLHPSQNSVIRRVHGGDVYIPTSIGRGCWIGIGVTVLPGASIAEGCIVAAGAVIVKSTRPNGLYAGVPARRIRDLEVESTN